MSSDLQKIRLVTARYWEMQGLRHVLIGTVFGVVFGTVLATGAADSESGLMVAVGLALALILPGMLWLDRYYERVFGRLKPSAANRRFGTLVVPGTLLALLWLHSLVGAPPFSLYFVGYAVFGLWIAWRDWPFRTHHLLDALAGALAAAVQWRPLDGNHDETFLWGVFVIGIAAIVSGSLDHRVLTTMAVMNPRGEPPC